MHSYLHYYEQMDLMCLMYSQVIGRSVRVWSRRSIGNLLVDISCFIRSHDRPHSLSDDDIARLFTKDRFWQQLSESTYKATAANVRVVLKNHRSHLQGSDYRQMFDYIKEVAHLERVKISSQGLVDMFEGFGENPYDSEICRGLYRFDVIEGVLGLQCTSSNTNPNVVSFIYGKKSDIQPANLLDTWPPPRDAVLEVTKSGGFIDGRRTAISWEGQYANNPSKSGTVLYEDLEHWERHPLVPQFQYYCRGNMHDAATIRPLPRIKSPMGVMVWCDYGEL